MTLSARIDSRHGRGNNPAAHLIEIRTLLTDFALLIE